MFVIHNNLMTAQDKTIRREEPTVIYCLKDIQASLSPEKTPLAIMRCSMVVFAFNYSNTYQCHGHRTET